MTETVLTPVPPPMPPPDPPKGVVPSASTVGSGIGTAAASLLFVVLATRGITLPAGSEALVAGLIATLIGYLPKSGRI